MDFKNKWVLIIIALVVVLFLIFYKSGNKKENFTNSSNQKIIDDDEIVQDVSDESSNDSSLSNDDKIIAKLTDKNHASNKKKIINYASGQRGNVSNDELVKYFNDSSALSLNENSIVSPTDESLQDNVAKYTQASDSKKRCDDVDEIFNLNNFLPKSSQNKYFDVPEPTVVKNRHLIDVTRHVGVDTQGSSMKNATHDIRGEPANPKMNVSPWMQSSIQPDDNIIGFCH